MKFQAYYKHKCIRYLVLYSDSKAIDSQVEMLLWQEQSCKQFREQQNVRPRTEEYHCYLNNVCKSVLFIQLQITTPENTFKIQFFWPYPSPLKIVGSWAHEVPWYGATSRYATVLLIYLMRFMQGGDWI